MDTFVQALRNLGPMRLAIMGGVILGLIGFLVFFATKLSTPSMTTLYGELGQSDAAGIVKELETRNIPFEIKQNGTQILVPQDRVMQLRLELAQQGLPSGGSIGYELFDHADSLGSTNFMQNVNLVRALEGELARTIGSISTVKSARVHLVMPRRELFSREKQEPSASVILQMRGPIRLTNEQVAAVQHLVASAVPQLTPNRISMIDNKGSLLASGFEGTDPMTGIAAKADERRHRIESEMARTIEALLEKTIGYGRVRAEVSVAMNFDRISTQTEEYNPDGQVVRSTNAVEENQNSKDSEGEPPISVGTNLPDANLGTGDTASRTENQTRTEETTNFEISKTVTNHIREGGQIEKLSVAVLIDEKQGVNENGDKISDKRSEEEMNLLSTLVRGAIGFDEDRGDKVEIIQMKFASFEAPEEELELFFGMGKNDILRVVEILVLSIVAILVILLVVRPLLSRAFEALPSAQEAAERLLADQGRAPALTGPGGGRVPVESEEDEEQFEELIDIDRVEGRVKASSVKKVGEIVEKHPEEALSILRSWMYQES
ncbi:flagellar basal-body MS-ring/collar protein FliF [Thalassospiraceae bacterium LMO-JJ14]|nr:flagellar basal-body MS-ring/collar protein FliF [Thalassospiraceae bacterium LMO-JJ14]